MSIFTVQCADVAVLRGIGCGALLAAIRKKLAWLTRWCEKWSRVVDPTRSLITRMRLDMAVGNTRRYLVYGRVRWFESREQLAELEAMLEERLQVLPSGRLSREDRLPDRASPDRTLERMVDPFTEHFGQKMVRPAEAFTCAPVREVGVCVTPATASDESFASPDDAVKLLAGLD
jgi:hypothetical protein